MCVCVFSQLTIGVDLTSSENKLRFHLVESPLDLVDVREGGLSLGDEGRLQTVPTSPKRPKAPRREPVLRVSPESFGEGLLDRVDVDVFQDARLNEGKRPMVSRRSSSKGE